MKVKIKRLNQNAIIPNYAKPGDAGLDITCTSFAWDDDGNIVYKTGLSFEIPEGFVGLLFPRSSNAKKELLLSNSVGVLDSGYRGEVIFKYKDLHMGVCKDPFYKIGDKIGQIVIIPYPKIEFEEVEELELSERGEGGFGHTGR